MDYSPLTAIRKTSRRMFLNRLLYTSVSLAGSQSLYAALSKHQKVKKSFTILFQGDSITDGNRGRTDDPNHIMGHGYAFSIASRLGADFPERDLRFINKGISGNTILDLAARWQQDALELKPDVISILVGVNDVFFKLKNKDTSSAVDFEAEYRKLLSITREKLPDVLFVLGEPFILPVGMVKDELTLWTNEIQQRQHVVKKLAQEFDAVWVGYQHIFSDACKKASAAYWIWDGIHPTVPGHELMAREWIRQAGKRLSVITPEKLQK